MLEDDEVSDFLDRNDDLGWMYWLKYSNGGAADWTTVPGMGPFKSANEATAAAKEAKLKERYHGIAIGRSPKKRPSDEEMKADRRVKINYLKQVRFYALDRFYEPIPFSIEHPIDL